MSRPLNPAERAALDEALAAQARGDERAVEAAWRRLVKAAGRVPRRMRVNGHDIAGDWSQ